MWKSPPLFPGPSPPGRRPAGAWKAAAPLPSTRHPPTPLGKRCAFPTGPPAPRRRGKRGWRETRTEGLHLRLNPGWGGSLPDRCPGSLSGRCHHRGPQRYSSSSAEFIRAFLRSDRRVPIRMGALWTGRIARRPSGWARVRCEPVCRSTEKAARFRPATRTRTVIALRRTSRGLRRGGGRSPGSPPSFPRLSHEGASVQMSLRSP